MIPRDPRCDNDDCDYNEQGEWEHVEECDALTLPLPTPSTNPADYPKNSFAAWMLGGGL